MNLITLMEQLTENLDDIDPLEHTSTMKRMKISVRSTTTKKLASK